MTASPVEPSLEEKGFTLIELILVIAIIGLIYLVSVNGGGSLAFWKQRTALNKLTQTITFLHHQAIADQSFYRFEIDFQNNSYRVGVVRPEPDEDARFLEIAGDAGAISLELAAFLSPAMGSTHTLIPPPEFPDLFEPTPLPEGVVFQDVKTPQGEFIRGASEKAWFHFSPRGFTEFAVIHLALRDDAFITITLNPFTGIAKMIPEYKDFEWTYGKGLGTNAG